VDLEVAGFIYGCSAIFKQYRLYHLSKIILLEQAEEETLEEPVNPGHKESSRQEWKWWFDVAELEWWSHCHFDVDWYVDQRYMAVTGVQN